jgi:hypothetical protein
MNADPDNAISTDMYEHYNTALFPSHASRSLAISSVEYFTLLAVVIPVHCTVCTYIIYFFETKRNF